MVYFPPEIFTKILEYNNHSLEIKQKENMKNIVTYFAIKNYINTVMWYSMYNNLKISDYLFDFRDYIQKNNKNNSIKGLFSVVIPKEDCPKYKLILAIFIKKDLDLYFLKKI
jgi:hypothetical protein